MHIPIANINGLCIAMSTSKHIAATGAGNPINTVRWLCSALNRANLSNPQMLNPSAHINPAWESSNKDTLYASMDGAIQKVTKSDRESSSFPISDTVLNFLATLPSKRSKNMPKKINIIAENVLFDSKE